MKSNTDKWKLMQDYRNAICIVGNAFVCKLICLQCEIAHYLGLTGDGDIVQKIMRHSVTSFTWAGNMVSVFSVPGNMSAKCRKCRKGLLAGVVTVWKICFYFLVH